MDKHAKLITREDVVWNQKETLRPPPYTGSLKKILERNEIGDGLIDSLPTSQLLCHGLKSKNDYAVIHMPTPIWVNWEQVRRGQDLWMKNLGRAYQSLGLALLVGFSISRFAEVLYHNGYAQSAKTAFDRYNATGHAIVDWFRYDLSDRTSRGRVSIDMVRRMHGLARRNSRKLFDPAKGEGVPLSQYDMAEVLLGFAIVTISIIEDSMGIKFSLQEKTDMTACWRIIGYYLGILDEYNPCKSWQELEACFEDYMQRTPDRLLSPRPCTFELQRTAIQGFGMGTGLGKEFWYGVHAIQLEGLERRGIVFDKVNILHREPKPGMLAIARGVFYLLRFDLVNKFISALVLRARDLNEENKPGAEKLFQVMSIASSVHDKILW
eukprot:CAMPEP_0204827328 /NCGR_PEP_ID=MMETSP1346-20131115/4808_1 /ASSEMBLY_ACC=CAM_ASM_000771 /TAXON_ID=215587 /ORGANISM="Aplanochytrium stocchinoi, Strain GSBS06" /LENGTH=379 /DNA_ID=CAMNT_0051955695 /DNA_START=162 /DNA_END=1299 /DNA_ORIENTATION=+